MLKIRRKITVILLWMIIFGCVVILGEMSELHAYIAVLKTMGIHNCQLHLSIKWDFFGSPLYMTHEHTHKQQ